MAASIVEKGYRDTTVADVVRIARTSRRNFYEHFEDRDACFLALFDATNDAMMRADRRRGAPRPAARRAGRPRHRRLHRQREPATRPCTRASSASCPALGQAGAERGLATLERFAALLVALVDSGRASPARARRSGR